MKLGRGVLQLIFLFLLSPSVFAADKDTNQIPPGLNERVWARESLIIEGNRLVKAGFYEQAVLKYNEAISPQYIKSERDKTSFYGRMLSLHRLQGKFREAFNELQWFMKINPKGDGWMDDKLQLEALIKAGDTKSNQPVHDYIKYLRRKYKNMLPPDKYDGNYVPIVVSKIIFCYGWIGDADGGIVFMDEILNYWEKKSGQNLHRPGNKNQYYLIRQAFEQDKQEGFKGCLDAKPGDACMGRATKALIQSDYFPW
jgi:hypothetical protein